MALLTKCFMSQIYKLTIILIIWQANLNIIKSINHQLSKKNCKCGCLNWMMN